MNFSAVLPYLINSLIQISNPVLGQLNNLYIKAKYR